MKSKMYITLAVTACALITQGAFANLCNPKHIKSRHRIEATELVNQHFSSEDYQGAGKDYDAHVIACNRKRDDQSKKIEKKSATHTYRSNVSARYIKGHIKYYSFAPMRYGYKLDRKNGMWYVTVAARFHFPKKKFKKKLDIPMRLARELGINVSICSKTSRSFGKITRGYVNAGHSARLDNACRVKRNEKFKGVVVTTHLMKYWKKHIQRYWSHDGITFKFKIVNLGELSKNEKKKFKKRNIVWDIRMNHNKNSRAMYRASIGRGHPLYTGLGPYIFRHEFGHIVGLDDEYHDKKKVPDWKKCENNGGNDYIMCNSWGNDKKDVKGVYPWIITRRHAAGKKL